MTDQPMNTEKLANLIAVGTREDDILDVMGCSLAEYQAAVSDNKTQAAIQKAKDERYATFNDINDAWDMTEQLGLAAVIQTLQQNPDPAFALAAASQANRMRRRDVGTGQIQPIQAQQNNVVVIKLNQNFTDKLADRDLNTERVVSSQGMPKDVDTLELRQAEQILLPVEAHDAQQAVDEILKDQELVISARR